jgi:DNA-binding IclR family transcriptional regulator
LCSDSSFQICDRLVEVIDAFTVDQPSWTLHRLADHLDMPRSTLHRYLHSLAGHALLEHQADGSYALGIKALQWAGVMRETNSFAGHLRSVLADLALQTGETAFFAAECAHDLVFLEVVPGKSAVIVNLNVGASLMARSSAPVQAIAAYWPQHRLDSWLCELASARQTCSHALPRQALLDQLTQVRRTGYARSTHEPSPDSCLIAAPILKNTHQAVGSVGVACPLDRCQGENSNLVQAIKQAAGQFSQYAMY